MTMSRNRPSGRRARVGAQAGFEIRALLSNGEQLLVAVVLPLLVLVSLVLAPVPALAAGPWSGLPRVDVAAPGVLALAVISTAFTGQAILLAYERRYGVLRLLGTTPLGRGGLLLAKAHAVLVVVAGQVCALGAVALVLGWRPRPAGVLPAVVLLVVGTAFFVALAVLVGGTLRAEAVLALANLLWVLLLTLGGVVLPAAALPGALGEVVAWLPSALLADGLRVAATGVGDGIPLLLRIGVLALWAAAVSVPAARLLRWSD